MAKITKPLLADEAHGGIGGEIVFRQLPSGYVAQSYPSRKSNSPFVKSQQHIFFTNAMRLYNSVKRFKDFVCAWNHIAVYDPRGIVGCSLFVSEYMRAVKQGKTVLNFFIQDFQVQNDQLVINFNNTVSSDVDIRFGSGIYCESAKYTIPAGSSSFSLPLSVINSYNFKYFKLSFENSNSKILSGVYTIKN